MNAVSIALLFQLIAPFGWAFRINSIGVGPSSIGTRPVAVAKASGAARSAGEAIQPSPSPPLGIPSDASSGNERRSFLRNALRSIVLSSALSVPGASALAETTVADSADVPRITHRVFVDVRISRADGTFYVRDADPGSGVPADEPFYGRIVLGLFGERTPEHVKRFLDYVDVRYDVDKPLPSYSRSKFGTLDTATGLLIGGMIPGLEVTTLAGGNVLEYSGRVFPAKLWLEDNAKTASSESPAGVDAPKLSHNMKRLLTHRNLDPTPSFGITTRKTSTILDDTHTIFGMVMEDESGFLDEVVDIPVLLDTGRVSRTTSEPVAMGGDVGGSLASSVFTAQRAIFRDAAKTFGDTRLEKVYDGKLLRRIEVTKVGLL